MEKILAWHFLKSDLKTQFDPRLEVGHGKVLHVDPPLKMCKKGLHASVRAIDGLRYAPGAIVCRVECSGVILRDTDKLCAEYRKCLWMANATQTLHEFAIKIAESALLGERSSGREPPPDSWKALEVKKRWLNGYATLKKLDAARSAAWSAAHNAAWSAARSAAWSAAWSAARSAAWSAAHGAAWSATWSAAHGAAWSAAESAAWRATWSAAHGAAWSATWSAAHGAAWSAAWGEARSAQNLILEEMLNQLNTGGR